MANSRLSQERDDRCVTFRKVASLYGGRNVCLEVSVRRKLSVSSIRHRLTRITDRHKLNKDYYDDC